MKTLGKKIYDCTPSRFDPLLEGIYETFYQPENEPDWSDNDLPEKLPYHLLSNAEIVSDRSALLNRLPMDGTVAELGVDEGDFSDKILQITTPDKLFLVDVWGSDRYDETKMRHVQQRFSEEIDVDTIEIRRQRSGNALESFDNNSLDWVYIDTTHSYRQTKLELKKSREKLVRGGFIAGHDYCLGNLGKGFHYGVIPAVHEFCINYDWELRYLTMETGGHWSFAIQPCNN